MSTMTADWPADAVLDEIYPQSFADSDGDGVGDLRGVIEHLDHLGWLGVDTIWFNPLLDSPFVDAGYDVADYLRVAPRYGTNDDLVELVGKARDRGIRVLLDLVAGHTSLEHPWFQAELHADGPHPDGNRYVWRGDPPRTAGARSSRRSRTPRSPRRRRSRPSSRPPGHADTGRARASWSRPSSGCRPPCSTAADAPWRCSASGGPGNGCRSRRSLSWGPSSCRPRGRSVAHPVRGTTTCRKNLRSWRDVLCANSGPTRSRQVDDVAVPVDVDQVGRGGGTEARHGAHVAADRVDEPGTDRGPHLPDRQAPARRGALE